MVKVETERSIDLQVGVTCESCGHNYQGATRITASTNPLSGLRGFSNQERIQKKIRRIQSGDFSVLDGMRCPECGYTQSWNIPGAQRMLASIIGGAAGLLAAIAVFIWELSHKVSTCSKILVALVGGAAVGGVVYLIARLAVKWYNPNWRREKAEKTIPPRVSAGSQRLR
jgi:hypothetical protein